MWELDWRTWSVKDLCTRTSVHPCSRTSVHAYVVQKCWPSGCEASSVFTSVSFWPRIIVPMRVLCWNGLLVRTLDLSKKAEKTTRLSVKVGWCSVLSVDSSVYRAVRTVFFRKGSRMSVVVAIGSPDETLEGKAGSARV